MRSVARAGLANVGLPDPAAAVAEVASRPAVELVVACSAVEAVIASVAVAAVHARAHYADVVARAAPAAVAAVAVLAEVAAGPSDAVAVAIAGHADVVARAEDAAVAPRATGVAGVTLTVGDELVGAAAQVDGGRHGQLLEDFDEVAAGTHTDLDHADAGQGAGRVVPAAAAAAAGRAGRHAAFDDYPVTAHRQSQSR